MPKLNFYDTDAVKAFTLDVLSLIHISEPTRL